MGKGSGTTSLADRSHLYLQPVTLVETRLGNLRADQPQVVETGDAGDTPAEAHQAKTGLRSFRSSRSQRR